jgi:hypothetical protein
VRVLKNARQSPFTVQNAAVCALSCVSMKNARQRLCRAFLALRRASETHGEGRVSRSEHRTCFHFLQLLLQLANGKAVCALH